LWISPSLPDAALDEAAIMAAVETAIRFMDNVIDVSRYPLPQQRDEALAKRRIGLGVTGLADALALCADWFTDRRQPQLPRSAGCMSSSALPISRA
jgi:hypothetical protein